MSQDDRPIANARDLTPSTLAHGPHALRRWRLGRAAGSTDLGCSLIEVPPGKRSWPRHWHAANEEALYVLSGEGTCIVGEVRHAIGPGDWVALPTGPAHAHQVHNTGQTPLRYLCISTMNEPDVSGYPDSGKIGVFAGAAPGGSGPRTVSAFFHTGDAADYWEGEPGEGDEDP